MDIGWMAAIGIATMIPTCMYFAYGWGYQKGHDKGYKAGVKAGSSNFAEEIDDKLYRATAPKRPESPLDCFPVNRKTKK